MPGGQKNGQKAECAARFSYARKSAGGKAFWQSHRLFDEKDFKSKKGLKIVSAGELVEILF